MVMKTSKNSSDSTRPEVGEIDTRAPFESVKAAVSLFGEGAFLVEKSVVRKSRAPSNEGVLVKEPQLHLALKELNKFKEQLKNAEITKTQALAELEKAKKTVEELTQKLQTVTQSKESAIKAIEAAKNEANQFDKGNSANSIGDDSSWKHELENAREQYTIAIAELDVAKQELRKMRQDFEASISAKVAAQEQVEEAEHVTEANRERANDVSKEIALAQESLSQVKLASLQAHQEQAKILAEKDALRKSSKFALEEMHKKLELLKKEFDPAAARDLEQKLAETTAKIEATQQEIESVKLSDLESVKTVTTELDDAKGALQKVAEEESSLRDVMESLKLEIESVRKEHSELKEKEAEAEALAGNLHVKLRKMKAELEAAILAESKARGATEELMSTLKQLSVETENARSEVEKMKKEAEDFKREAEAARFALVEAEKQLEVALKEAEVAKAAEATAVDQINVLTEKMNASRASTSEMGAQITISKDEHEALSRKDEESNSLAEMKVAAAVAQVEAVRASENEALKRLEVTEKEIEEIKAATEEALKRAEMAEAAKRAVEGELKRWREREQKKAAEAASRILAETEVSIPASPMRMETVNPPSKSTGSKKPEKTSPQKKTLLPNLSGIFQRKKGHLGGGSPSYLPGEKPV